MNFDRKKAVVLLSGGLDSATTLAVAARKGFECHALSFRYGQRHAVELDAARKIAKAMQVVQHVIMDMDLRKWGGSALTSSSIKVPRGNRVKGIPATYVPARNTIFLAFATAWAETLGARDIFIGVNSMDYSGYPDCRPQFIRAFAKCANLGTRAADGGPQFKIHAPLQYLTKTEIIRLGTKLGVDYSITRSCYSPDSRGRPCEKCASCEIRGKGFKEAGIPDPAPVH